MLFDSWYSSQKLLKRIKDYGWYFVTQVKKNRIFNGNKLSKYRQTPYWNEVGILNCGIKVFIVKNGKKYYTTNRLSLSRKDVLDTYKIRQHIEEVNKELKQVFKIKDCQVRSITGQENHIWFALISFCLMEKERQKKGLSMYKLKKDFIFHDLSIQDPLFKPLKKIA